MHEHAFLETADRIGSRLCRDAVWSGNQCNWLGWGLEVVGASWSSVHRAQSATLYDGTAGIALFLARLYGFTKDRVQKAAAIGALNRAVGGASAIPEQFRASVYSGTAGIAWATIEVGTALGDDRMVERGLKDLKDSASGPPNEAFLDIIGGSAGTIQLVLDMARRFKRRDLIDLAVAHGQMLLRTAAKTDSGWSWDTLQGQSEKHLCGYGHGAGGIGCALLELWAATGAAEYRNACMETLRYERSHFSDEHHNWPDLRSMNGMPGMAPTGAPVGQSYGMAWCHGGPGVGLARLRMLELLDSAADEAGAETESLRTMALEDLNEALYVTAAACSNVVFPNSGNMSLCHGIGGNADLLLLAADIQARADLRAIAEAAGHQAIAQIRTPDLPWPCGVTTGGETPNLMIGLAGIGHFYLRLYDSASVSSLLLLRPQHAAHEKTAATQGKRA